MASRKTGLDTGKFKVSIAGHFANAGFCTQFVKLSSSGHRQKAEPFKTRFGANAALKLGKAEPDGGGIH
jgi:hypothetical protein